MLQIAGMPVLHQILRMIVLIILTVTMTACKSELYGALDEQEGNEMYAILKSSGINVEKVSGKDQVVSLMVDDHQTARAILLLKNHGYPKSKFLTMNDVFPKEGVISSPTEEKARYIYAVSQDISSTLSEIDGVLIARVHVVLPEKKAFSDTAQPSSASVFLKHTTHVSIDTLIPKIKTLVANSILGLHYDNVSVALFPSDPNNTSNSPSTIKSILFLGIAADSVTYFYLTFGVMLLITVAALSTLAHQLYQQNTQRVSVDNE